MKTAFLTFALAAISLSAFAQDKPVSSSLPIGAAIPSSNVTVKTTDGNAITLGQVKTSKGLLVMFSCNTCPFVVKSQPRTKEAIALAKKDGLGMVIINSNEAQRANEDSYEAMKQYAKTQGYTVPYVVDTRSQLANSFGATRTPEIFLFDGNGKLIYHGAMEDNPGEPGQSKKIYLNSAVAALMAGTAPDPSETKSIGCGIKRLAQ